MSRRTNCKSPGPSIADFEATVGAVFDDYPDAIFIMPAYLAAEAHDKIKVRFPRATRSQVERAIAQMLEWEQLWRYLIAGARFEDQSDAFVYRLNPNCRLGNIIPFLG